MKKILLIFLIIQAALCSCLFAQTAVVYFSATGNTERVAEYIAQHLDADMYRITPREPYSRQDLVWQDPDSRVNWEHEHPDYRAAMAGEIDLSAYDTVFIGYPLWWGQAPSVVYTFIESTDLDGKTVIPFCTSSSSRIGDSAQNLEEASPSQATWLEGQRFRSRAGQNDVTAWVDSLDL